MVLEKSRLGDHFFARKHPRTSQFKLKSTMSAKPPTEAIVNPTLVGVSAGGAAEGTRTRSGRGLVQADLLRVSANQDKVPVPTRKRLPRAAAGDAVPEVIVTEAIGATKTKPATPRRRRSGPSARKRKEARTTPQVPGRIDETMDEVAVPAFADEEPVEDPAQDAEDDDRTTTPEVSEDDAAAEESDDDNVEDARSGSKVPPPATAQRELSSPDNSEDDEYYFFADLGRLMLEPASVAYIFARHAERERRAGLDVTAQVWATTKQLVGEAPPGDKLSAALAAANRRAYLVVMRGGTGILPSSTTLLFWTWNCAPGSRSKDDWSHLRRMCCTTGSPPV